MRLPFQRSAPDRAAEPHRPAAAPAPDARRRSLGHWHESSLELQRGLEVTELFTADGGTDATAR